MCNSFHIVVENWFINHGRRRIYSTYNYIYIYCNYFFLSKHILDSFPFIKVIIAVSWIRYSHNVFIYTKVVLMKSTFPMRNTRWNWAVCNKISHKTCYVQKKWGKALYSDHNITHITHIYIYKGYFKIAFTRFISGTTIYK